MSSDALSDRTFDHINSTLLSTLILFFAIWWISNCAQLKSNPKWIVRLFSLVIFFTSILTSLISDYLLIFLAFRIDIDKTLIQKIGALHGKFPLIFGERTVDLIQIYNILITTAEITKISTLFLLISLLGTEIVHSSSAKYYSFLRIPVVVFFRVYQNNINVESVLFIRSVFFGLEITVSALLLMLQNTKFKGVRILIFVLISDSFLNYTVNILSVPLEVNEIIGFLIFKLGFVTQVLENILTLAMICPLTSSLGKTGKAREIVSNEVLDDELVDVMHREVEVLP